MSDNSYKFFGSVKPYYEKFNENNNYVKVLYQGNRPLQAQELDNSQTYMQTQLATLTDTLYKEGSAVNGATIKFSSKQPVLNVQSTDTSDPYSYVFINTTLPKLVGQDLYCNIDGTTKNIRVSSYYIDYQIDADGNETDTIVGCYLLFSYISEPFTINLIGESLGFYTTSASEIILLAKTSTSQVNNPTYALTITCSDGYLYVDGIFVKVTTSTSPIIVDIINTINDTRYSSIPVYDDYGDAYYPPFSDMQYSLGYRIRRKVVTANDDEDLYDQSSGTANYKSSGADRYKIYAELCSFYYYNESNNNIPSERLDDDKINYIQSLIIKNDIIIKQQVTETNGTLMDTLARRTYDESGSYTVNPWKIQLYDIDTDYDKYRVDIAAGKGYIYGYKVETLYTTSLTSEKPRNDYIAYNNNSSVMPDGCYTYLAYETTASPSVNALKATGFLSFSTLEPVMLYDSNNEEILPTNVSSDDSDVNDYRLRVIDVSIEGKYCLLYFVNTKYLSAFFSRAKKIVSTTNTSFSVNLLMIDGFAHIYGTENSQILNTGLSYVRGDNTINGTISFTYSNTVTATAVSDSSTSTPYIRFNLPNNLNSSSTTTSNSLIYIYDNEDYAHLDTGILDFDIEGVGNNNYITIKTRTVAATSISGITLKTIETGHVYTICFKLTQTGFSSRVKTIKEEYEKEVTFDIVNEESIDRITLSKCDILKVNYISTVESPTSSDDIIPAEKYTVHNGQKDYIYDYGYITGLMSTGYKKFYISYDYYEHSGYGPISAYSYCSTDNNQYFDDNDAYTNIGTYRGNDNVLYYLRDCLDFRRLASNSNTNYHYASPDTAVGFSVQKYLPRYDTVMVSKEGVFSIVYGIPSENPQYPAVKDGCMAIYNIQNAAYTNNVSYVTLSYIDNQRYTMKDIAHLDDRITNMENVVALNLLEQSAVNMQITDETGLNRYKTGIFVDNFGSFDNCDYTNDLWDCNIDAIECCLRPQYAAANIPFAYNKSSSSSSLQNIYVTLPEKQYVSYINNTAISEVHNVQEYMFAVWTGGLTLTPAIDTWVNDLGNVVSSVTYKETAKPPTTYRTWSVSSSSTQSYTTSGVTNTTSSNFTVGISSSLNDVYRKDTTYHYSTTNNFTTVNSTTTTETTSYVGSWTESNTYKNMESQDTFMRQTIVKCDITGMCGGRKITVKFDGNKINLYTDTTLKTIADTIDDGTGSFGQGKLTGYFKVPANTPCGTVLVEVTHDEDGQATAEYTSHGKTVWVDVNKTYTRVWTAVKSYNSYSSAKSYLSGSSTSTWTTTSDTYLYSYNPDPIAESFSVDSYGIVLDSIDVYLGKIDETMPIQLYIVPLDNGYPSSDVVAMSLVTLSPSDKLKDRNGRYLQRKSDGTILVDSNGKPILTDDASKAAKAIVVNNYEKKGDIIVLENSVLKPTRFIFPVPLYLNPNTDYAFVVASGSYNYEIYTSTLGVGDLITGIGIKEQPFVGSMFQSQNAKTWTAVQSSDITFKINQILYETSSEQSAIFNIDYSDTDQYYTDMQTLALNTYSPENTSLTYYYRFSDSDAENWTKFENRDDIFNTERKNIENSNSMQIKCIMSTTNTYVSPQIDAEQVYGIFTYNTIKYKSVVYPDGTFEESPYVPNIIFDDTNVYNNDTLQRYHCGTYISKPITLETESTDLRVILESYLPNYSKIYVYFKTVSFKPYYIVQNMSYGLMNSASHENVSNLVGKTCCAYDYDKTTQTFTKHQISSTTYFECTIDRINTTDTETRVYLSSYSADIFNDDTYLVIADELYDISTTTVFDVSKTYTIGDYVLYNGEIYMALVNTTSGSVPSTYNEEWQYINAFLTTSKLIEEDNQDWNLLSPTTDTVDMLNYVDRTYIPSYTIEQAFTMFTLKIEAYSYDPINVPKLRNLRAIAIS